MPGQAKPDVNTIWASDGTTTAIPEAKQRIGYVEEIPYWDDFNWLMQQFSMFLKHTNQEGVPVWDATTAYPQGGLVKSPVDYNLYRALLDNTNQPPVAVVGGVVNGNWVRISYTRQETLADITSIFVGQTAAFAAPPPEGLGWLLCDGSLISRVTYARLFSRIGVTWGAGDGVNTFRLPDARGEVIRGLDNGRGVDPGRAAGSAQGFATQRHSHYLKTYTAAPGTDYVLPDSIFVQSVPNPQPTPDSYARTYNNSDEGVFANETRMRNIAMPMYIMS